MRASLPRAREDLGLLGLVILGADQALVAQLLEPRQPASEIIAVNPVAHHHVCAPPRPTASETWARIALRSAGRGGAPGFGTGSDPRRQQGPLGAAPQPGRDQEARARKAIAA